MPDPLRKTVSASQVPAIFGLSPYQSRFSLYHWMRGTVDESRKEHGRMTFGTFVEPFILERAAEVLRLDVRHNKEQSYFRHASYPLGCTIDADVVCPVRGPGVIQAKAVDRSVFREGWTDRTAPKFIELQLATEMLVTGSQWGAIAVMIGNNDNVRIYERIRSPKLEAKIIEAAALFLADVKGGYEPDPIGAQDEIDVLDQLYGGEITAKELTIWNDRGLAEDARLLAWAKVETKRMTALERKLTPRILAAIGTAMTLRLPGSKVRRLVSGRSERVLRLPVRLHLRLAEAAALLPPGPHREAIIEAIGWEEVVRMESTSARLRISTFEGEEPDDDDLVMTP